MTRPFEAGERVLLLDQRDRTYLVRCRPAGRSTPTAGRCPTTTLIGQPEGVRVETIGGMVLTAFRPRFADFALKMPRGAQVIYPKDLGPILRLRRHLPGRARAGGRDGVGRADDRAVPRRRPRAAASSPTRSGRASRPGGRQHRGVLRDRPRLARSCARGTCAMSRPPVTGSIGRPGSPRAVGRAGDAWRARWSPAACSALPAHDRAGPAARPGVRRPGFQHVETFETLRRSWHVTERSVRPDHRMVGHTGFLTIARRVGAR